jgi:hypothetical protein
MAEYQAHKRQDASTGPDPLREPELTPPE